MLNFLSAFIALQNSQRALRNSDEENSVPLRKGEVIFLSILIGILIAMTITMIITIIMFIF